jgi:hypothetical protein
MCTGRWRAATSELRKSIGGAMVVRADVHGIEAGLREALGRREAGG